MLGSVPAAPGARRAAQPRRPPPRPRGRDGPEPGQDGRLDALRTEPGDRTVSVGR